jgi:hypothetical protein
MEIGTRTLPLFVLSVFLFAATAFTQDPIKVDPKHYKVAIDNPQVRVLRIHYGPHEKSVMHEHPAGRGGVPPAKPLPLHHARRQNRGARLETGKCPVDSRRDSLARKLERYAA